MATIATLAVDLTANTDKLISGLNQAQSETQSWSRRMVSSVETVGKVALGVFAAAASAAVGAAAGLGLYVKDATLTAARVSELNAVLGLLGVRAGWSEDAISGNVGAMKELGIRTDVAQGLLAQFARYQLDAADATKIARVAQDAAVLSMQDSSDALDQIMHGILTQNTRVLRNAGLNIMAGESVKQYAESLGKTAEELTTTERIQGMLNAVLEEGEKIAGTYATAMEEPGKQLRSLSRHFYEAKVAAGEAFLPAFGNVIGGITGGIKWMRALLEQGEPLNRIFAALGDIAGTVTEGLLGLKGSGEGLYTTLERIAAMAETAAAFIEVFVDAVTRGDPPLEALRMALESLGLDGLAATVGSLVERVQSFTGAAREVLAPILAWLEENVKLQDVLAALGIAIGVVLLGALKALVVAVAPVIAVFALIVATVALVRQAWESNFLGIQEKTQAVIAFVQSFIADALAFIQGFWGDHGQQVTTTVSTTFETIRTVITTVTDAVKGVIQGALEMIRGWWGAHGDNVMTIVHKYMDMARDTISTVINAIGAVIQAALAGIQAFWAAHGDTIMTVARNTWDTIKAIVGTTLGIIGDIIDAVAAAIRGDWRGFGEEMRSIWDRLWRLQETILRNARDSIKAIVGDLVQSVIGFFRNTDWGQVGRSIINGIASGITGAASRIADAARQAAQNALNAAKGFLGISSPSKVFREQIGKQSVLGWAAGLQDVRPVERAAARLGEVSVQSTTPHAAGVRSGRPQIVIYGLTLEGVQDAEGLLDELQALAI